MATNSSGIMMPSQVCKRFVVPKEPREPGGRHRCEASNYFHRPPDTARHNRLELVSSSPAEVSSPPPEPVVSEPAPAPRVEVDPETIVSWGSWTRAELYEQAKTLDIKGRSSMTRRMLLKALVGYIRGEDY